MKPGRTLLTYLLTGLAVLATTALAGLLTDNPLTSALVAVAWAGVLAWRHGQAADGDASSSTRAEDTSVPYRQR